MKGWLPRAGAGPSSSLDRVASACGDAHRARNSGHGRNRLPRSSAFANPTVAEPISLRLSLLPDTLAVCRLGPDAPVPDWAWTGEPASVTRTRDELSIVCRADAVPDGVRREDGWRCLEVQGPLDFALTGIMARLTEPLAAAGISVFVLSTFDTDYVMVRAQNLERTVDALRGAGHRIG